MLELEAGLPLIRFFTCSELIGAINCNIEIILNLRL